MSANFAFSGTQHVRLMRFMLPLRASTSDPSRLRGEPESIAVLQHTVSHSLSHSLELYPQRFLTFRYVHGESPLVNMVMSRSLLFFLRVKQKRKKNSGHVHLLLNNFIFLKTNSDIQGSPY